MNSTLAPPAPGASPPPRAPWAWRVREAATAYSPMLAMLLLALGTWWLVNNTPRPANDKPAAPPTHEADYTMHAFTIQRFTPQGRLRVQLDGDELRHYPDNDTMEIDNVRLRAIDEDGRETRASARQAVSNGDASEVQLKGGAQVVRDGLPGEPPIEFRGEFLQAFTTIERVRSHLPVRIQRGSLSLAADVLDYDNLSRIALLQGRVRASLPPASEAR